MLLQEQMKQNVFSYNERAIINFILEKQEKIKDYSTKMIGDETCCNISKYMYKYIW